MIFSMGFHFFWGGVYDSSMGYYGLSMIFGVVYDFLWIFYGLSMIFYGFLCAMGFCFFFVYQARRNGGNHHSAKFFFFFFKLGDAQNTNRRCEGTWTTCEIVMKLL